jgi:hypothetical protein
MNFKSILVLGLSVATLGLTLPAHADTGTVIDNSQDAVITGNDNVVHQKNETNVRNRQTGRPTGESTGTSATSRQSADVLGDGNLVRQKNETNVENIRRNRR